MNMLTRSSKYVLNGIRELAADTDSCFAFLSNTTCICLYDDYSQTFDYTKYKHEIRSIVRYLIENGYLWEDPGSRGERFYLTHLGLHAAEINWNKVKMFFLTNCLVPILVAYVTTLITLRLQGL